MTDPVEQVEAESAIKDVAAGVTVTAQVASNRSIVIQTYLPRDATLSEFHALLDKVNATIDRQEAKAQLEDNLANLALEEKTLKQFEDDFAAVPVRQEAAWGAAGKKGAYKPTPAELQQREQARISILRYRDAIAKRKMDIAKCEALITTR